MYLPTKVLTYLFNHNPRLCHVITVCVKDVSKKTNITFKITSFSFVLVQSEITRGWRVVACV